MREILFRGKPKVDGKWIYGYYADEKAHGTDFPCIVPLKDTENDHDWSVIPETVGQWTGLTDNRGIKIFEGDVVNCDFQRGPYEFTAVVEFGNPNSEYNWGYQLKRISGNDCNPAILLWVDVEETGAHCLVIGNIHDNPELLKGDAE